MRELTGYRPEHRELAERVWHGPLLLSTGAAGPLAAAPPEPEAAHGWCRVLTSPGHGIVVFDDVDPVHRRARLSVAALTGAGELLAAAVGVAAGRLRLHRLDGLLAEHDTEGAKAAYENGFSPELTIPDHLWSGGRVGAGVVWGRCFDAA
ncbi:hypothetical protein [Amycolatopsis sp. PS_44_ISF1]|uniref:hypothetical protein n=1 Tax=Amycolatopsis sp. PS_44_ISF1 TaxID=2974917 RepID=UPI0028DE2B2C|nr:hypothetical protein [Amycolatopsis sp. PS_44_ISF1]MDT8912946.1 hypothetical protein [Amycolatopsis sp. PS_44_ISF1]